MGKWMRFVTGAAAGALAQYLTDPRAGRSRRARLRDQGAARARDGRDALGRKIRYQRGRVKGLLHEASILGGNKTRDEDANEPSDEEGSREPASVTGFPTV